MHRVEGRRWNTFSASFSGPQSACHPEMQTNDAARFDSFGLRRECMHALAASAQGDKISSLQMMLANFKIA